MFNKLKLAAAGLLLLAPVGDAQTYYSVDVFNDQLCEVKVSGVNIGAVTYLGSLQDDLGAVDLAWHKGALYAKTFGTGIGNRICQIVTEGTFRGYALQGAVLNGGGPFPYQGAEAAGLASDGQDLYLTYSSELPGGNNSVRFGKILEPISSSTIQHVANMPADVDAMGFTAGGGGLFWGMNSITTTYTVRYGPSATGPDTLAGSHTYNVATNPLDSEFFSGIQLVAISENGLNLLRVSRVDGAVTLVTPLTGLMPNGFLRGLARRSSPCTRVSVADTVWIP